jgi:hypothetical protein
MHCNNILIYIQHNATLHSLFYLETALHISGGTITHHQKRKQLYLQHLVFVTPLLLCQPQHTQTSSSSSTIVTDSSNGVTKTRCCRYSCLRSTQNVQSSFQINKLCNVASCWIYIIILEYVQSLLFKVMCTK